jgi:threonine dehydrogenase-like Zn-dependent dehydrogenase
VRAVLGQLSPPRYVLTAAAQRLPRGLGKQVGWGPAGVLRLVEDLPAPVLPDAPGWVRLRPELSGICGSDVGLAHAKLSFVLSAYYTAQRQVPGHEIVAVVDEVGPGVTRVRAGDRVAVTACFACEQRGLEPLCRACAEGHVEVCERFDVPGTLGCTGASIGFEAAVGGGWGEQVVAHESQLYDVGTIPSRRAVLAEPASVALHAALRWERRGDRVVVIGPGTVGLLVVASLRTLHPDLDIIVLSPSELGTAHARRVGATRVLPSGPEAIEALAASDGGRVLRAQMTALPILEQGVDAVFDAVASPTTIDLGLHLLRSTGTFVMVGAAGRQPMDWSLVWNRQLSVLGTVNLGFEERLGGRHTMAQVVEWLGDPAFAVDGLVTHVFDLDQWTTGLATASAGPAAGCVKATLRPNPDLPLVGAAPLGADPA